MAPTAVLRAYLPVQVDVLEHKGSLVFTYAAMLRGGRDFVGSSTPTAVCK